MIKQKNPMTASILFRELEIEYLNDLIVVADGLSDQIRKSFNRAVRYIDEGVRKNNRGVSISFERKDLIIIRRMVQDKCLELNSLVHDYIYNYKKSFDPKQLYIFLSALKKIDDLINSQDNV